MAHQKTSLILPRAARAPSPLQRATLTAETAGDMAPPIVQDAMRSPGQPLDAATRSFMEPRFGHDFSHVRVHADARAAEAALAINAQAFTVGDDIALAGEYTPSGSEGRRLMAHELVHVVQHDGTRERTPQSGALQIGPAGSTAEHEADRVAAEALSPSGPVAPPTPSCHVSQPTVQRKLLLGSEKDKTAFRWFLTPGDAANFTYSGKRGAPLEVTMVDPAPKKVDDQFRVGILRAVIEHPSESLLVQGFELDTPVTPHHIYENGKLKASNVRPTLRAMASNILGAAGVTIPSVSLALQGDPQYSGAVSGVANQSWIFYSTPTALAHEFGHAILAFSGTRFEHGATVPKSAGVLAPDGTPFAGEVDVFIRDFAEEQFGEIPLFDKDALHFSPTVVRKWPEPPDFKPTFTGTWLQFVAKYPGAKVSQEVTGKGSKKKRRLRVCVPKPGEICW